MRQADIADRRRATRRGSAVCTSIIRCHCLRHRAAIHRACSEGDARLAEDQEPYEQPRNAPFDHARHEEAQFYLLVSIIDIPRKGVSWMLALAGLEFPELPSR